MKVVASLSVLACLIATSGAAADILMTFEDIAGDIQAVNTWYSGVTFGSSSTGSPLVTRRASTNTYNVSSWPSGTVYGSGQYWVYGEVGVTSALDNSGNDGRISFNNANATYVELGYCASSTFWLSAFDLNGVLLDSTSGGANLRYSNNNPNGPGTLRVEAEVGKYIAYVMVHDTGNYWVIDNVRTDASGIITPGTTVPAPGAAVLCPIGLALVGWARRKTD